MIEHNEWADLSMAYDQPTPMRWPSRVQAAPAWLTDTLSKGEVMGEYDIFTNGLFDKELEPVAFLLDHEVKTISGAALVLAGTGQNWMNVPIITVRIQNDERVVAISAFPLELIVIVAGLRIASKRPGLLKIVTDCEAALKLLSSPEKLNYWSNKANVADQSGHCTQRW